MRILIQNLGNLIRHDVVQDLVSNQLSDALVELNQTVNVSFSTNQSDMSLDYDKQKCMSDFVDLDSVDLTKLTSPSYV